MSFHFGREKKTLVGASKIEHAHIFSVAFKWAICHEQKKCGKKIVWIENMQNWLIFLSFRRHRRRCECVFFSFRFVSIWCGLIWYDFCLIYAIQSFRSKWNRSIGLDAFHGIGSNFTRNAAHNFGFDRLIMSTKCELSDGNSKQEHIGHTSPKATKLGCVLIQNWYSSFDDNLFELSLNWVAMAVNRESNAPNWGTHNQEQEITLIERYSGSH